MGAGIVWCPHCASPHTLGTIICPVTAKTLERGTKTPVTAKPESPMLGVVVGGRYRIVRLLGRGATAEVFEAENIVLRRPVAVKVLRHAAPANAALRLEREALLVASVQHPNICDVYDAGTLPSGVPYVVLERLSGETIASLLQRTRRLPLAAVGDMFTQILSGLQRAHGASIIHRDLKPQNVFLVDRLGCPPLVKLLDFGFAKDLSETFGRSLTVPPRMAVGTPAYMAPEQLRGGSVSTRSDLFSVGVMMYEALTGRHPFRGAQLADLETNLLRCEPRSPLELRPSLPRWIEPVLMRALAKDPARRWGTAVEFQRALGDGIGAPRRSGSAPPDSSDSRPGEW